MTSKAFKPCYGTGINYNKWSDKFLAQLSIRQPPLQFQNNDERSHDKVNYTIRTVYTPLKKRDEILHLALSVARENPSRKPVFSTYPEISNRYQQLIKYW